MNREAATACVEVPNPIGLLPPRFLDIGLPAEVMGAVVLPLIIVASIVAIAGRYRGSSGLERLQMRWLAAAFGSIAMAIPVGFLIWAAFDPNAEIAWVPASVAFMLPPIAIGIAVTRYRLYEIDRLISRGLSWAVLSGLLLAVYAGAILLLQSRPRRPDPGPDRGRRRAPRSSPPPCSSRSGDGSRVAVDHRFNRARYDAERTATDFAERLRNEVDLDHLRTGARRHRRQRPPS